MARQALLTGEADTIIAGGMESMTQAPFLMAKHRSGQKYGHDKLFDHMALDGLEDAYEGKAMGVYSLVFAGGVAIGPLVGVLFPGNFRAPFFIASVGTV